MPVFLGLKIYLINFVLLHALVAELVDALDSKSSSFGSVGSIPTQGTKCNSFQGLHFFLILTKTWAFVFQERKQDPLFLLQIREQ